MPKFVYVPPSKKKYCFSRERATEIVNKFRNREIDPFNLKATEQRTKEQVIQQKTTQ